MYLRVFLCFFIGFLDGEIFLVVLVGVLFMMFGVNLDLLCGVVGKVVLEFRYFRIFLGFFVDFLDGEMFVFCCVMDLFCWCVVEYFVLFVKK